MKNIILKLPKVLCQFTDGKNLIELPANSTTQALQKLIEIYPALQPHIYSEMQQLHNHFCLFLNNEQILTDTPVQQNDIIKIVPAMIGG